MAHRIFSDASGREWLVWDVYPQHAERLDEVSARQAGTGTADRPPSRSTSHLPSALAEGWLCFESGAERRRLGPIPVDWARLSESELSRLVDRANRVEQSQTRIDTTKLRAMARTRSAADDAAEQPRSH